MEVLNMVLKGRRIRFREEEEEKPEENFNPEIDRVIEQRTTRTPVMAPRALEMDANSFIGRAINKKHDMVDDEKRQLNNIKSALQQHCDELEALNYIASGEPQMAVVDVLEMVNDFKKEFGGNKPVEDAFTKMEQTILESTIDSYQGNKRKQEL
jgi:hypothetical protein